MMLDEYIEKYVPLYWDISKKRVHFNQLTTPIKVGVYLDYLHKEGINVDFNGKSAEELRIEIEELLDLLTLK